jgi:hypothetical protein
MAEGVNLQGASAVVLLSLPSVMRIAEQRIGRVDRLNSPHRRVDIYWPEDHEYFILDTDTRFYRTAHHVELLLGGNIEIPVTLTERLQAKAVRRSGSVLTLAAEAESGSFGRSIQDAFAPLRGLVSGDDPLIREAVYTTYRTVSERVISCVSVVSSAESFAFFALRETKDTAPRWVFIMPDGTATTDLRDIARELRQRLPDAESVEPTTDAWSTAVGQAVTRLRQSARELVPHRYNRALDLLEYCLSRENPSSPERARLVRELLNILHGDETARDVRVDLRSLGREALKLAQPALQKLRASTRRHNYVSLGDLKGLFRKGEFEISTDELSGLVSGLEMLPALEDRVVAAIVGAGVDAADADR